VQDERTGTGGPGSEEIETVVIVDTLVRGGIDVVLASCCPTGARQIRASRGVQLVADCHLDELTTRDFDAMVVPGGLPGSEVIRDTPRHRPATGAGRPAAGAPPSAPHPPWYCTITACWGMRAPPAIRAFRPVCPPQLSTARVVTDEAHRLITSQGRVPPSSSPSR
jgi:4-methyl-5(b-hydroxyethyl)-thiazole monophosphate biosynthesis